MATPSSSALPPSDSPNGDIGLTFVEMMFAVAIGDAASQIAKVIDVLRKSPDSFSTDIWMILPSTLHLSLVIVVIATSWVGWSHSTARKEYMRNLKGVFPQSSNLPISFPFLMLLLDVALVVCYFILSEGAEIPTNNTEDQNRIVSSPTLKAEVDWILIILVVYFIWNVLYCIHKTFITTTNSSDISRRSRFFTSLLSIGVAGYAWWRHRDAVDLRTVLMVDGALLGAILIFRLQLTDNANRLVRPGLLRASVLVGISLALIHWA